MYILNFKIRSNFDDYSKIKVKLDLLSYIRHNIFRLSVCISCATPLVKLTFMSTLLSRDLVKFFKLNFVSWLKILKTYSPSVFFKDGLKLYVFESLKLKSKV